MIVQDEGAGALEGEQGRDEPWSMGVSGASGLWPQAVLRPEGDLIVDSMDEKNVSQEDTQPALVSAMDRFASILSRLEAGTPAFFLDFDGTLAGIVDDPSKAHLAPMLRGVLERLSRRWPIAIVSGREVSDVRARTGVTRAAYAGDHGMVFSSPDGERFAPPVTQEHLEAIDRLYGRLCGRLERLEGLEGVWVEQKKCTLSVHTRQAAGRANRLVERVVDEELGGEPLLQKTLGKQVVEVRPAVAWDKGAAVLELLGQWQPVHPDLVAVVIGDDVSDEAAFEAVRGGGVTVFVGPRPRATAAEFRLDDPEEVERFLTRLEARLSEP